MTIGILLIAALVAFAFLVGIIILQEQERD